MNRWLNRILIVALAATVATLGISIWKEKQPRYVVQDSSAVSEAAPTSPVASPAASHDETVSGNIPPADKMRPTSAITVEMEFADEYAPQLRWSPKARGELSKTAPASVRIPPRRNGCLFGEVHFGCGALLPFALIKPERSERAALFIVDLNMDGDLTNDGPAGLLNGTGTSLTAMQPLLELPLPDGNVSRIRLWLWTSLEYPKSGDDTGTFNFYIRSFMRGKLRLPGDQQPFLLAVMDHDGNGHYSADKVFIDWNRNGKAEDEVEWLNAGESVRHSNSVVHLIQILPGARKVIVEISDAGPKTLP